MAKSSLSNIQEFISSDCFGPFWIGMDVHKRTYHIALLRGDGQYRTFAVSADSIAIASMFKKWEIEVAAVAYEAGPTGFGLARALMDQRIKVIVAAPSRIPRASSPSAKTDRLDCIKLARMAKGGIVSSIAIPSPEEEAKRSLSRRREQISQDLRRTKQRIKSLLLFFEIKEPQGLERWSKKGIAELAALSLPDGLRYTLDNLLLDLDHLTVSRDALDIQLKHLLSSDETDKKAMQAMQTVPGVGFVTASKFRTEIFKPHRFKKGRQITGMIGLAPLVKQSGESNPKARLIPVGKTSLRSTLIQAAWVWIQKDPGARRKYNKLKARSGVAQKAIVGVARKLSIILWRLCIELRPYRPEPVK